MQKKHRVLLSVLFLFAGHLLGWEQSNEHYSINFEVISGGTGNMSGLLSTAGGDPINGTVSIMVDQPIITTETMTGGSMEIDLGFWSQLLLTPGTPKVQATYDTYPDRIVLNWSYDPNDPPGTQKHKIYRNYSNGSEHINETPSGVMTYTDAELPAGQQYEYRVRGSNSIQYSNTYQPIEDAAIVFGKTSSNGSIGGLIQTNPPGNTPIPNARVTAYNAAGTGPAWGQSIFLDGVDDVISFGNDGAFQLMDTSSHQSMTMELWFKPDQVGVQTLISKGNQWELGMASGGYNYLYFNMDDEPILSSDAIESQAIRVNEWNHVALVRDINELKLYINGWLATINGGNESVEVSQQSSGSDSLRLGDGTDHQRFRGLLDEFRCWNLARDIMFMEPFSDVNNNGVFDDSTDFFTDINGDGFCGASDSTLIRRDYNRLFDYRVAGEIIEPALVACFHMDMGSGLTLINSSNIENNGHIAGTWATVQAPVYPTSFTDAQGEYSLQNLNFGDGRQFRVTPQKAFHEFSPTGISVYLNTFSPAVSQINFAVTNMITVSGFVSYDEVGTNGNACGEPNVEIWIDNENTGERTDADGYYLLEIEPGRTLTIVPHKQGREASDFYPQTKTFFNVIAPKSQNFVDSKLRNLRGSITGGACEYALGPQGVATVTLSADNQCFSKSTSVDAGGNYEFLNLAPMAYSLSVDMDTDIPNIPYMTQMELYFANNGASINIQDSYDVLDSVWLTEEDTVKFNYRSPIDLRTTGWSINELGDLGLLQNGADTLDIYVFENYYGGECHMDTGSIYVKDWISDRYVDGDAESGVQFNFAQDSDDLNAPSFRYGLLPGLPRLDGDHKKNLELRGTDPSGNIETNSKVFRAVVLGHRPNQLNFATTAPEIPLLILRRPPGDGSRAVFSESSSSATSFSLSLGSALSSEESIQAKLGVETEINIAPWGVGTSFNIDTEHTLEAGFSVTGSLKSSTALQWITTTTSEYTTATAVELMGDLGTVFVGGAMNLLYGSTNVLDLLEDDGEYEYRVTQEVIFMPNGFATTYIYTRGYVENYLLPELVNLSQTDTNLVKSIDRWNYILNYEDSLRWATPTEDNFSFSGGGQSMTNTLTSENSQSLVFEEELELDTYFAESFGLEVAGFGVEGSSKITASLSLGSSQGVNYTNTTTSSYTLMDDDDGDDYSVDVGSDPVYGTPVFKVVAGNSSCPYEEWRNEAGTIITTPRDEPGLTWLSPSTVVNVHPDDVAELRIGLSNLSSLEESRVYYLSYLSASNTFGAEILINGQDADESAAIPFELEYLGNDSALISVARPPGSDVYEFDGLLIKFAPECETNYAGVTQGYTASFDVHFARPCTEAEIYQPSENWIVNTISGDTMTIVVQDYDLGQSYFDELLVQYSAMGDETWYAVDTLDADTLRFYNYLYSQLHWDVGVLPDGVYDIRLQSKCLDGLLANMMDPVRGILDRQIPEVLGLPEPLDGVLNFNDAIALNFTEPINPASVDPLNVTLHDNSIDETITAFDLSVSENRLVITPTLQNRFIENHILNASVEGYEDLNGNPGDSLGWTFTVDRNPVAWSTSELEHIAFQGDPVPIVLQLNNTGSSPQAFFISGTPDQTGTPLPEWLTVSPAEGSLNPGGSFDITFNVASDLNNGEYDVSVYAVTPEGYEPFNLHVVSMCPYPEWTLDFSEYEFSMNVTARLFLMNTASEDIYDRVGAFVNEECRGWAQLQYIPELESYQAFLTVHSDQFSGERVDFHIWDRSSCAEFWEADTNVTFVDGGYAGSPADPIILNATGALGQSISLNHGFTWFSLNLEAENMSIDSVLADIEISAGDRIIGQTAYSQYSELDGWVGMLTSLDHHSMYQLDLAQAGSLIHVGFPILADTVSIPTVSGWNWVSYLPSENMNVNNALASLTSSTNDLVKSQTQYAQFVEGIGWLGSMTRMYPGFGYKLEGLLPGVLQYPATMNRSQEEEGTDIILPDIPWTFETSAQYQYSMGITALLESDTIGVNNPADAVIAFVGDEVRGIARPVYVPALDAYRVFLAIHGDQGDEVSLNIWDAEADIVYHADQNWIFEPDAVFGNPLSPEILTRAPLGIGDKGYIPDVYSLAQNYPNPFNPETRIGFGLPEDAEITIEIYNLLGQHVTTLVEGNLTAGYRFIKWRGMDDSQHIVSSGVYLVVMNTEAFREVRKMVLLR